MIALQLHHALPPRHECGILGNITDMDTSMTPFAAGLEPFVDLDKDDFIGRKALLNADRRSRLFGITCADAIPGRGSLLLDDNQSVGRMTAGVESPTLGCGVGYGVFDEPGDWPGRSLRIRLADGSEYSCEVVTLPFFDPDKHIVRGIDRSIPEIPAR